MPSSSDDRTSWEVPYNVDARLSVLAEALDVRCEWFRSEAMPTSCPVAIRLAINSMAQSASVGASLNGGDILESKHEGTDASEGIVPAVFYLLAEEPR